jgi:hypothetical protein
MEQNVIWYSSVYFMRRREASTFQWWPATSGVQFEKCSFHDSWRQVVNLFFYCFLKELAIVVDDEGVALTAVRRTAQKVYWSCWFRVDSDQLLMKRPSGVLVVWIRDCCNVLHKMYIRIHVLFCCLCNSLVKRDRTALASSVAWYSVIY